MQKTIIICLITALVVAAGVVTYNNKQLVKDGRIPAKPAK